MTAEMAAALEDVTQVYRRGGHQPRTAEALARIDEAKGKPCARCGGSFPPVAMDFHHRDPTVKTQSPVRLAKKGASIRRVLEEIAKCDVLCACCHRILHASD